MSLPRPPNHSSKPPADETAATASRAPASPPRQRAKKTGSARAGLSKAALKKAAEALANQELFDPQGVIALLEPMIAHGLLDTPLFESNTALTLACENVDHDLIQALLAAGADVNAPTLYGQSPLMQALSDPRRAPRGFDLAMLLSCMETLHAAGADIHHRNQIGQQAIHWAGWESSELELARWLLARGADPSSPCLNGVTPLHHAAIAGPVEAVRFFLDAGADIFAKAKLRVKQGDEWLTPLDEAIRWSPVYGNAEVIALLSSAQLASEEGSALEQIAPALSPATPDLKKRPGL